MKLGTRDSLYQRFRKPGVQETGVQETRILEYQEFKKPGI